MSDTGVVSVLEIQEVTSAASIAEAIAGFWVGQLQTNGELYDQRLLLAELMVFIEGRLRNMMEYDIGGQWLISHVVEPYPPFMRALSASGVRGARWPKDTFTSVAFHGEIFDVRHRIRSVESRKQYEIKPLDAD